VLVDQELAISVLTNAADGWAGPWLVGIVHILEAFAKHGAPSRKVKDWTGRWWSLSNVADLVPMGDRVLVAMPATWTPPLNATEVEVTGPTEGRIEVTGGYGSQGEPVRCVRKKSGIAEVWFAGSRLVPEGALATEMTARYGAAAATVKVPDKPRRRKPANRRT
jgi:D-alanyl-D-alanine carboxypeptidase